MASKLCDSCKSATATLFCRADSAFLCLSCDSRIHAANKLASRHARVWVCEVCEQAPAHVTCKADAAALCVTCDRDIHSANPLARRHERLPVTPFYDSVSASLHSPAAPPPSFKTTANFLDENYFSDEEEAEAASWLLPNPNPNSTNTNTNINNKKVVMESPDLNTGQFMFADMDPYLDLDYVDPKQEEAQEQNSSGTDGVVPVHGKNLQVPLLTDQGCFELDFSSPIGSKAAFPTYAFNSTPCLSQSVSSSSLDVGVVPDGGSVGDISNPFSRHHHHQHGVIDQTTSTVPLSAVDREARVLRYREKRKNRKFEKTIRYASRKAYAETRPRIKGRFAKRTDLDVVDVDRSTSLFGFGVVPSF